MGKKLKKHRKQLNLTMKAISEMRFKHRATINYDYSSQDIKTIIEAYLKSINQEYVIPTHVVLNAMFYLGYKECYKNDEQSYFDISSIEVKEAVSILNMK